MSRDKHIEIALQDAERYARPHMDQGKVATYIPELAKGDPTKLGICIRTPDGEEYCQGDCQTEFSIQSISKTITLILAGEIPDTCLLSRRAHCGRCNQVSEKGIRHWRTFAYLSRWQQRVC